MGSRSGPRPPRPPEPRRPWRQRLYLHALNQKVGGSRGSSSRRGAHDGDRNARVAENALVLGFQLVAEHLDLDSRGGQKAHLAGADNEVFHHDVKEETTSGAFARHMCVAAAQLGVQFVNALTKKGRNIS